jgi:hypothetical protein
VFIPQNSTVKDILGEVNVPLDSELLVAQNDGQVVQLMEAYRVHSTFSLEVHRVGNWSRDKGLQWVGTTLYTRRNNLRGVTLRAVVTEVCHDILRKLSPYFVLKQIPLQPVTLTN